MGTRARVGYARAYGEWRRLSVVCGTAPSSLFWCLGRAHRRDHRGGGRRSVFYAPAVATARCCRALFLPQRHRGCTCFLTRERPQTQRFLCSSAAAGAAAAAAAALQKLAAAAAARRPAGGLQEQSAGAEFCCCSNIGSCVIVILVAAITTFFFSTFSFDVVLARSRLALSARSAM